MKAAIHLPIRADAIESGAFDVELVAELAGAVEAAGFDAVYTIDHPAPPADLSRVGHHALDPFVFLSVVAARTTRLRLLTHLVVAPYRNPFVLAKSVATLDRMSGGRVLLGLGAGYLQPEFDAVGASFEHRNQDTDEVIEVIREVWTGEAVTRTGRTFTADAVAAKPVPVQPGGPPIWVGGNSARAIERAVLLGDAWMPFPNPSGRWSTVRTPAFEGDSHLVSGVETARRLMAEHGRRAGLGLVYMPLHREMYERVVEPDRLLASAAEMAELGLSYAMIGIPAATTAEFLHHVEDYGSRVIPQLDQIEPGAITP